VQEFVKEANAEDIRCLVIGDKVVASMMHRGKEGDFRSNLHRGGSAFPIKISPQELATAIGSAKALGPSVCGVGMLRSNHGPVVMEVNSSPGLEGIEKATNVPVAELMIEFIEKNRAPAGRADTLGRAAFEIGGISIAPVCRQSTRAMRCSILTRSAIWMP
jgi:ribosomal protein S6--L-glutamate ligase